MICGGRKGCGFEKRLRMMVLALKVFGLRGVDDKDKELLLRKKLSPVSSK